MGEVYRIKQESLHRFVALKTIRRKYADSAEAVQRFVREAVVMGSLNHPGVPPIHEIGYLSDGRPYYLMKLIEGQTLQEQLEKTRAGSRRAA